jgi:dTDP-4-amino-4,6-dideoxy-D-galactose acyltransferase
MINKKDWDSNFFGYPVGEFIVNSGEVFDASKFKAECAGFKLVYVFSEEELTEERNLKLVDKKVAFSKELNEDRAEDHTIIEFNQEVHSYDELLNLALLSGIYSRFYLDIKFVNNEYFRLYKEWLDKSISREIAQNILIKIINNKIVGFVTLKTSNTPTAQIGLIAVDKNFYGENIGTSLIRKTEKLSKEQNCSFLNVVTQLDNAPGFNLYVKNNFSLKQKIYTYHLWNV